MHLWCIAGGIVAAHGHNRPFVHPKGSGDGGVLDVVGVNTSLKEGICRINDGENPAFGAVGEDVGDVREGGGCQERCCH